MRTRTILVALLFLAADQVDARSLETTWKVDPDVRVEIEIMSGRIEVKGWERNEVRLEARGSDDAVRIDASPGLIVIGAKGSRWFPFPLPSANVHLELRVPTGCSLAAKTLNASIEVEDTTGEMMLRSVNARIEVKGAPSEARIETVNGKIEFEGEGSKVRARTINGSIELKGVAGELDASTVNGSIKAEAGILDRADLHTVSGSIDLEARLAPGARIIGKSHSGSIVLRLPEDTSARFEIETFSGSIRNELGAAGPTSSHSGPGQHLDFVLGEGDARVTLGTFSASVRLEKQ